MDINSEEINQQIAVINNSVELFKSGPDILMANRTRASTALEVGKNVLAQIESEGMNEETDARANKYLANINKALPEIKELRAPLTQVMTSLAKMFTEIENELDPKKEKTIAYRIQQHRNDYAKKLAEEEKQRQIEAENKRKKATEAIEIKAFLRNAVFQQFNSYMLNAKQKMLTALNQATLITINDIEEGLKGYQPMFKLETYNTMVLPSPMVMRFHTLDELKIFTDEIKDERFTELANTYAAEMSGKRDELISLVNSKRNELQELENLRLEEENKKKEIEEENRKKSEALQKIQDKKRRDLEQQKLDEEKKKQEDELLEIENNKKKIADEARQRELDAEQELITESNENLADDVTKTEVIAEGDKTLAMFTEQEEIATTSEKPAARQGYEIIVLHQAAYGSIFQLWFTNEGNKLPLDKLEKISLGQMKTYCEKHAHKTSEKIESKFLKYEPTYKAVNKAAKK